MTQLGWSQNKPCPNFFHRSAEGARSPMMPQTSFHRTWKSRFFRYGQLQKTGESRRLAVGFISADA